MPSFTRGSEGIQAANQRGSKFVPSIRFETGVAKYVQFLHPLSDVYTALMHPYVIVSEREDGTKIPATFISRRDPTLDGADGYDPLIDRFHLQPTFRTIGLGVELELVDAKKKTFAVATRQYDSKEGLKEVPAVGLIIQSPSNFWRHVDAMNDSFPIEDNVFAVKRSGKSRDTQYTFIPQGQNQALKGDDLAEIEEFQEEFDFDAYLDELSSLDRVHRLIDPLPEDWVVNQYADKGSDKAKPKGRTRNRPQEEDADEAPPAATRTKGHKFTMLREELSDE